MRTTLSLAALIKQFRKAKATSLKETASRKKFRTTAHSSGRCFLQNLDNTGEVLVIAEREQFK